MPLYFNISGENDGESDISLIFNDLSLAGMAGAADGASVSFGSRVSSGAGLCVTVPPLPAPAGFFVLPGSFVVPSAFYFLLKYSMDCMKLTFHLNPYNYIHYTAV